MRRWWGLGLGEFSLFPCGGVSVGVTLVRATTEGWVRIVDGRRGRLKELYHSTHIWWRVLALAPLCDDFSLLDGGWGVLDRH